MIQWQSQNASQKLAVIRSNWSWVSFLFLFVSQKQYSLQLKFKFSYSRDFSHDLTWPYVPPSEMKYLEHTLHWKRYFGSSVCLINLCIIDDFVHDCFLFKWLFNKLSRRNLVPHNSHLKGFSLLCVLICSFSKQPNRKVFPQVSHLNDFSPVWTPLW